MINHEILATIKVLFRDSEMGSLWGIPYEAPGQNPGDLWRNRQVPDQDAVSRGWPEAKMSSPGPREDWVDLRVERTDRTNRERALIQGFVDRMKGIGALPTAPWEWRSIAEWAKWESEVQFVRWLKAVEAVG